MVERRKKTLFLVAAGLVAAAGLGVAAWFLVPGLRPSGPEFPHAWPGKAQNGYTASRTAVSALSSGAGSLLGTDGVWMSWHRLAGKAGVPPAEKSAQADTGDQVLLLRHAAESGDQGDFQRLYKYLTEQRTDPSGRLLESDGRPAGNRASLDALRAMAEAYSAWGGKDLAAEIRRGSGALLDAGGRLGVPPDADVVLPGPSPTPVNLSTPTPAPTASGTSGPSTAAATAAPQTRPYCALAGLDLYAMRLLSAIDTRWEPAAAASLEAIRSAYIGTALPLYRAGADPVTGSTVAYAGDSPVVDTMDALLVVLHLCEVGEQRSESIAWIRRGLYNDGEICSSYAIVSGEPFDRSENPAVYAVVARIARILGDEELYNLAADRLLWHVADLRTSPAYGTVFRETEDGRIEILASDNAWALLGLD